MTVIVDVEWSSPNPPKTGQIMECGCRVVKSEDGMVTMELCEESRKSLALKIKENIINTAGAIQKNGK